MNNLSHGPLVENQDFKVESCVSSVAGAGVRAHGTFTVVYVATEVPLLLLSMYFHWMNVAAS
jgi:hypothetical protein